MAWFRAGGGGIPSSLKSDMNDVFNKKFGTVSQDYPPNGWPADVNLMGPLPEKTASGAIASFSDGADTVPVKSCTVAFGPGGGGGTPADPVALVGYNSVTVRNVPGNWWDEEWELGIWNASGEKVANNNAIRSKNYIALKPNQTYFVYGDWSLYSNGLIFRIFDAEKSFKRTFVASSINSTLTLASDECYVIICTAVSNNVTTYNNNIAINYPATKTTYTPYVTPETISDSFDQTVYGGERDLVNEIISLKQTYNYYNAGDVTGLYWNGRKTSQVDTYHRATFRIASSGLLKASTIGKCNRLSYSSNITGGTGSVEGFQVVPTDGLYFCIPLDLIGLSEATSATDDSVFLAAIRAYADNLQFSLELATPVDITGLTAHDIETNYADNNFYADIPDSTMTVEYRADIPLALNA